MALMIFGLLWHVFAVTGMILLAPYGKKWEGFYLGLLMGPVGLVISLMMRERLRAEAQNEALAEKLSAEVAALREEIVQRLPNGKLQGSQGF